MDLSGINLNLLPVLEALLEERNTTLVANKLNLTQPFVSKKLQELRVILNDELLVKCKSTREMQLTPKAFEIRCIVKQAMWELNGVFSTEMNLNTKNFEMTYRISTTELYAEIFLSELISILEKEAPKVNLEITTLYDLLNKREIIDTDLLITKFFHEALSPEYEMELIKEFEIVCLVSKNNPSYRKGVETLDLIKTFTHIVFIKDYSIMKPYGPFYEANIHTRFPDIKCLQTIFRGISAFGLLHSGDYIMIVPSFLKNSVYEKNNIAVLKIPFKIDTSKISMIWHKHNTSNPAHHWIRGVIKDIFWRREKHFFKDLRLHHGYN